MNQEFWKEQHPEDFSRGYSAGKRAARAVARLNNHFDLPFIVTTRDQLSLINRRAASDAAAIIEQQQADGAAVHAGRRAGIDEHIVKVLDQ